MKKSTIIRIVVLAGGLTAAGTTGGFAQVTSDADLSKALKPSNKPLTGKINANFQPFDPNRIKESPYLTMPKGEVEVLIPFPKYKMIAVGTVGRHPDPEKQRAKERYEREVSDWWKRVKRDVPPLSPENLKNSVWGPPHPFSRSAVTKVMFTVKDDRKVRGTIWVTRGTSEQGWRTVQLPLRGRLEGAGAHARIVFDAGEFGTGGFRTHGSFEFREKGHAIRGQIGGKKFDISHAQFKSAIEQAKKRHRKPVRPSLS